MPKSRLVTASLLGSIDWLKHCPDSWKSKAVHDLRATLARDYSAPPGPALLLGTKFEDAVYACAGNTKPFESSEDFKWFVEQCRGGQFQRKTKSYMTIDGEQYCIYGKIDVFFPDHIKDIKTTSDYKGEKKYLSTAQHKLYCLNEHVSKFTYLVGEFNASEKLISRHAVEYEVKSWDDLQAEVEDTIHEAIDFLSRNGELMELYLTKFSLY